MGKLWSFLGGRRRVGWLALSVGLALALLIADGALARSRGRDRRGDDSSLSGGSRGGDASSVSSSGRGSTDSGGTRTSGGNSGGSGDRNGKSKDDDGDDDARGNNAGRPQLPGKGANDPPGTVVEMLQRMFANQGNAPGATSDAKSATRSDDGRSSGKSQGGDKGGKTDSASTADANAKDANTANTKDASAKDANAKTDGAGKKDQPATPTIARAPLAQDAPQAKRALQRARSPSLSWQREASASDLFRRDEVLVVNASPAAMAQLQFAHVESITTGDTTISRFVVPDGLDAIAARQVLRQEMPNVASAFNYVYRPYVAATEAGGGISGQTQPVKGVKGCSAERCYGPGLINWQLEQSSCTVEIGVGVIDTGFDSQHPAFKDRKINWSTVLEGNNVSVQTWHGTGVLALLSGNPQGSTPGLIPQATFTATNTFYADGSGQPATDTTTLVKALKLMETYKVKVVNLSLAGPQDATLHKQIKAMSESGVLFVAAAGNGGPFALPSYPAAYPEVIAVTAVDRNLVGYRHATRGPHIDLAAPGVDIWTALPDKREGPQTGTSFAVPYVTAAAAAVYPKEELTYRGQPLDPKKAVLSRLTTRDLGPVGRDTIYGQGLLQAPPKCADKSNPNAAVEVSSAWSPTLQPVLQPEPLPASSLMSLTPSAEVRWPGVVQHLSFQGDN